jgi:uncharacterized cupin superfamily protein
LNKETIIKNILSSSNKRYFLDGSERSVENLRTSYVGLGTYQPGWRWSEHAGKQTGKPSQNHIGYILSGSFTVKSANGEETIVGPGEAFELAPGHDAWVNGEEPCIALDFGCNEQYGRE